MRSALRENSSGRILIATSRFSLAQRTYRKSKGLASASAAAPHSFPFLRYHQRLFLSHTGSGIRIDRCSDMLARVKFVG